MHCSTCPWSRETSVAVSFLNRQVESYKCSHDAAECHAHFLTGGLEMLDDLFICAIHFFQVMLIMMMLFVV
jgi:hypothetical protein